MAKMMVIRIRLICIVCGEIFSRHQRVEFCAYCGGAVEPRETIYVED